MNNKRLGNSFEQKVCDILANDGWWVHFISPDARGAQPFDIIATKDNVPMAIDCKTCDDHIFRISRLEDNQIYAFLRWKSAGNDFAYLMVLHKEKIYAVPYWLLKELGKVDLRKMEVFRNGILLSGDE